MIKMKFFPEYNCYPIWKNNLDYSENIDPRSLPISSSLLQDILEWDNEFHKYFDFKEKSNEYLIQETSDLESLRDKDAYLLYLRLCKELGENYDIEFYFYVSNSKKREWGL